ncbi:right-handed parallel beta-helix repeat-containing protein [Methanogenium sp. S4BF]|uniref:right-handed parallel beta-helix repeat-containing protein n=1 Tax=Methanogenium sp. S4BF TaxID=1789226 RepID=UPI00241705A5|nr:right-handed parallel beta-helix repeat-containing protein [Methanogenium sp. S4BF]WFN35341.1 right-handed parallel beta-helix repeat-containing protein [Methanogenium sp. S4BF]
MPYEDIVENMGIGIRVAILLGLIGIFLFPWVFEVAGPELGPTLLPMPSSPDDMPERSSFIVAAHDSSAALKSGADYVCDGAQDQKEINAAFNALPQGGEVILTQGTFNCDEAILPGGHTKLRGQGVTNTFLKFSKDGQILVDKEYVTLEKFYISGSAHTADIMWYGVITLRAGHCTVRDVTGTCDKTIEAVFMVISVDSNGYNKIIEDIEFTSCKAIDPAGFGFIHNSWSDEYNLIKNVRYTNCHAINCGRYDQFNPWVTGFDFAELNDMDNLRVTGCIAEGCWESGFHFEYDPIVTDAILTDCIARNNGQKPFPTMNTQEFLAGFYVGRGDVTFRNCQAEGNSFAGFYVDDGSDVKINGCTDLNTAVGESDFSIYKPASFYIISSTTPVMMEDCSSIDSNGHGLFMGPVTAQVENFVITNAAGMDGTAVQLGTVSGSVDIHASGNRAPTLISVVGGINLDFTGSIVSDVAQPFVVDGSGTSNIVIHDVETISNTLPAKSTGITITENVPAGAVQIVNCHVISPKSSFGFM